VNWMPVIGLEYAEKFAALVIANHPPQSFMTWQEGYEAGKQAEREACAKIAEYKLDNKGLTAPNSPKEWWNHACQNIRDAIRARGDT
jgi:hypothetical protein